MMFLAADITMHTAPKIVVTALLGCALVGVAIALVLRIATRHSDESRPIAERGDVRRAVRLIARFTRTQHRTFVVGFVLLSIEAVTQVFAWYPLAYMIDYFDGAQGALSFPGISSPLYGTIAVLTSVLLVLLMVNSATDSLAEIRLARGGRTLGFRMRVSLFSHLQRLSLAFHDRSRKGDVMFRVVGDVKEFEQFVIDSLSDLAGSLLLLVATIAFLLYEAWQVCLVGLIVIPGTSAISYHFSTRIKAAAKRQRAREGDLANATQEMLNSIRVVQTFGRGGHDEQKFIDNSGLAMTAAMDAARLEAWFSWIVATFEAIAIAAVIWVGVYLMQQGSLSLGTLTLIALLIRQMFKPSKRIIKEWNVISKVFASVERVADLLDRPVTVHDEPGAVPAPRFRGQIEFRDVSFAYHDEGVGASADEAEGDGKRLPALSDVSFTIDAGEVVAISGPSGAGKTTIAQLIPRLYDPPEGTVMLDGHDVRSYTLDSIRSQISMVLQETALLSGTVAENIAYGRPEATRDAIVTAAVRANAHEFIETLPGGYDCDLSEQGSNLSGGQRQRIAIARALIRATPIMILDEPTTGLDAESTDLVLTGLRELMKGKTTVLISHDPQLLESADRVLRLRSGRIVRSDAPRPAHAGNGNGRVTDIDPRLSPELRRELPGLEAALDEGAMRRNLQPMLGRSDGWKVGRCSPGKILYTPGLGCTLRYQVELQGRNGAGTRDVMVGARIFSDPDSGAAFLRDRLAPLAERARERAEMRPFAKPVAGIDRLGMVAYAYPIDAELPALIAATDPAQMSHLLGVTLSDALGERVPITECVVDLASYPRGHRCLLRYDLTGPAKNRQVYGKMGGNGSTLEPQVMDALRAGLAGPDGPRIPRPLGLVPDLDLVLLEAIPGRPEVGRLLVAHARGTANGEVAAAIESCARIAARVHTSDIAFGKPRTLYDEVASLHPGLDAMRRMTPALGERVGDSIDGALAVAAEYQGLPQRLSHGDYTHNQVVFDQDGCGLLDFDDVCLAEPALDLGRFRAYLRVAARKAALAAERTDDPGGELCRSFMAAYIRAAAVPEGDRANLEGRTAAYEAVTLARIVVSSWQQLKPARTACALSVLEELMTCPPTPAL
jgi:ABC-type multidrug transport system fused ATPase/permease subunit